MMSWFSSPVYSRYWKHYQQAMSWYWRHRRAYCRALEAAYGPDYYQVHCPSSNSQRYADWHGEETENKVREDKIEEEEKEAEEEEENSESEIECDVSNMEISEELRQYFAQTEKHREELSKYPETTTGNPNSPETMSEGTGATWSMTFTS